MREFIIDVGTHLQVWQIKGDWVRLVENGEYSGWFQLSQFNADFQSKAINDSYPID